jgi:hypothetical protein
VKRLHDVPQGWEKPADAHADKAGDAQADDDRPAPPNAGPERELLEAGRQGIRVLRGSVMFLRTGSSLLGGYVRSAPAICS